MHNIPRSAQTPTSHSLIVRLRFPHQQRRRLAVQGVGGVRVEQELGQEDLEHVDEVCRGDGGSLSAHPSPACCMALTEHRRPRLIDDVEAHGSGAAWRQGASAIRTLRQHALMALTSRRRWGGRSGSQSQ